MTPPTIVPDDRKPYRCLVVHTTAQTVPDMRLLIDKLPDTFSGYPVQVSQSLTGIIGSLRTLRDNDPRKK